MNPYSERARKSILFVHQDAWFSGIDNSMKTLGAEQMATSDDIIRRQNAAIRDCWVVTGDLMRQAMFALSKKTKIYPEELEDDTECRKMLTQMKARA
ncbi:MAG: hypothetical protein OXG85_04520 [Chloroflexi bacterium]|nr:hypothetical protein [Chloroflexota bacterium]